MVHIKLTARTLETINAVNSGIESLAGRYHGTPQMKMLSEIKTLDKSQISLIEVGEYSSNQQAHASLDNARVQLATTMQHSWSWGYFTHRAHAEEAIQELFNRQQEIAPNGKITEEAFASSHKNRASQITHS